MLRVFRQWPPLHSRLGPHLSLLVHSDDPRGGFMWRRHKDGLCTDSVHVDTHSRLQVVQVNVTVLCYQINDAVLTTNLRGEETFAANTRSFTKKLLNSCVFAYLHSYREVCLSLWWEKHVYCFLSKWLVSCCRLTNFNDVQL